MVRVHRFFVTLSLSALVIAVTGCAGTRKNSEIRLPGSFSGDGTNVSGVPGPGSPWGPDGAPLADPMGSGLDSQYANQYDTATDSLAQNASLDGVGSAVEVADLEMVHFQYDQAELKPEWQKVLDSHASWLTSNGTVNVQVEGHCDERGTEEYNISLGQRRADIVREYLVSKGVESVRISTISYGKLRPLTFDQNDEANALNRRAMFLVYTPEADTMTAGW